jgi:hypothetical protein
MRHDSRVALCDFAERQKAGFQNLVLPRGVVDLHLEQYNPGLGSGNRHMKLEHSDTHHQANSFCRE